MTNLERFREHCRRMAEAEHKPECPMLTAVEPFWTRWAPVNPETGEWDISGDIRALGWRGPKPAWERPHCDGCNPAADRALFARLAAEVDAYYSGPDLFGEAS